GLAIVRQGMADLALWLHQRSPFGQQLCQGTAQLHRLLHIQSSRLARELAESCAPGLQTGEDVPVGCTIAPELAQHMTCPVASRAEGVFCIAQGACELEICTQRRQRWLVAWLADLLERAIDAQALEPRQRPKGLARLCQTAFQGVQIQLEEVHSIACIELLTQ